MKPSFLFDLLLEHDAFTSVDGLDAFSFLFFFYLFTFLCPLFTRKTNEEWVSIFAASVQKKNCVKRFD